MASSSTLAGGPASSSSSSAPTPDLATVSFARGVIALLTFWPALRLALANWSDSTTPEAKRIELATELIEFHIVATPKSFPEPTKIEKFLLEYLEEDFGVQLDDRSEVMIARDLGRLWKECNDRFGTGVEVDVKPAGDDFLLNIFERLAKRVQGEDSVGGSMSWATRQRGEGEDDGDDSSSDDDDDGGSEVWEDEDAMDVDEQAGSHRSQSQQRWERVEPQVDDDGFTTVQKSRRRVV